MQAMEANFTARDWDFELDDIDGEGLVIWHGQLDVNCSIHIAEKAAALFKGVETRFFDEEVYNLVVPYKEKIMRNFLPHT